MGIRVVQSETEKLGGLQKSFQRLLVSTILSGEGWRAPLHVNGYPRLAERHSAPPQRVGRGLTPQVRTRQHLQLAGFRFSKQNKKEPCGDPFVVCYIKSYFPAFLAMREASALRRAAVFFFMSPRLSALSIAL